MYETKIITQEMLALAYLAGRVLTYPGFPSSNVHVMLGTKAFEEWPEGLILDWKEKDILLWWSKKDQNWYTAQVIKDA